jgi:hypothetical protein
MKATTTEEKPTSCCGGPASDEADACCVQDAEAKAAGESGCACSVTAGTGEDGNARTRSCCD